MLRPPEAVRDATRKDRAESYRRKKRFIVELRYDAVPEFVDVRGQIVSQLFPRTKAQMEHWQAEAGQVLMTNSLETTSNHFAIGVKRTVFTLEDESLAEFIARADAALGSAHDVMGKWWTRFERVGVRFLEIAPSPKATFQATRKEIIDKFHRLPAALDLSYTDSQSILVHEFGRFSIGPTRLGDEWIRVTFANPTENIPDQGVAIDIDSFARDVTVGNKADVLNAFHKVLELSQAVEEELLRSAGVIRDGNLVHG